MTTPVAPPASFPGTIATFTTKEDGEIIYGAHANQWQNEIVATQQILGRNPQVLQTPNPSQPDPLPATVSDRIGLLEGTVVYTSGNQTIGGNKEFTDLLTADNGLLIKGGTYEHRTSGYRLIGDSSGYQGKNSAGTANADLPFQPNGGMLRRGGHLVWDDGNDGAGSGLDADLLDGHQASEFLLRQGCVVRTGQSLYVPQNPDGQFPTNYWRTVPFNQVYWEYRQADGLRLFQNGLFVAPDAGLWLLNITLCFQGPAGGWRGLRAVDTAQPVNGDVMQMKYYAWDRKDYSNLKTYAAPGDIGMPQYGEIYEVMFESTRTQFVAAGSTFRIDAWSDGPDATYILPGGVSHNHLTTEVTWAQIG